MCDSSPSPGADKANRWELSSSGSSPRSNSPTNTNSLFSSPESPADTEQSFPSLSSDAVKQPTASNRLNISVMPSLANHVFMGQTAYAPGQIKVMAEELQHARKSGAFPSTTSTVEDPQTIVEDYQHLQHLRDARGDPGVHPPPQQYNVLMVDVARRIKARDDAHGGSTNLQEMDHRVQGWMNSINKEARMLEITQAALQRKGINNPTQDDLDAIAEEFMQIAERTLLDVANPLRMNASRMEGNISRLDSQLSGLDSQLSGFDSQLSGFDGAMAAQINGLSSLNNAVNTSMSAQVNTLNTVLTNLNKSMNSSMTSQLGTLNTMLSSQSSNFNGSVNMLNTALNTVTTDLHQLTSNLPALITTAVQAAVHEQLSSISQQHGFSAQHRTNYEQPPGYATATRSQQHQRTDRDAFTEFIHPAASTTQTLEPQQYERVSHQNILPAKSKLKRLLRCITEQWRSKKGEGHKEASSA